MMIPTWVQSMMNFVGSIPVIGVPLLFVWFWAGLIAGLATIIVFSLYAVSFLGQLILSIFGHEQTAAKFKVLMMRIVNVIKNISIHNSEKKPPGV